MVQVLDVAVGHRGPSMRQAVLAPLRRGGERGFRWRICFAITANKFRRGCNYCGVLRTAYEHLSLVARLEGEEEGV